MGNQKGSQLGSLGVYGGNNKWFILLEFFSIISAQFADVVMCAEKIIFQGHKFDEWIIQLNTL